MSLGYNDLNDLIQNQRALAELVYSIREHYDEFEEDADFVREVNEKIQELNQSMTDKMDIFNGRMSDLDDQMQAMMLKLQNDAKDLKEWIDGWKAEFVIDANGHPTQVEEIMSAIINIQDRVLNGKDNDASTSMDGMNDRLKELEKRNPSLVLWSQDIDTPSDKRHPNAIYAEDIPITERVNGVLYGRITNQVTDIESGQVIKISPYLQGVVTDEKGDV